MASIEVAIWKGTEVILTAMASAGAKVMVEEAVKKLTPENLTTMKKCCVEAAKWGGTTAVGSACAYGIHKNVENTKKAYNRVKAIFEKSTEEDAEPVIEVSEDINPVEIEEETETEE